MANWYVYSGAAGTGTGADWTNAYVRLRLATAAKAAGDVFFVAHDHAETEAAANTIQSPGTEANPCRVYCVNRAGSVPPVSADLRTTATIATTAINNLTLGGSVSECYGIIFNCGSGSSTVSLTVAGTTALSWRLVSCHLRLNSTSNSSRIVLGGGARTVTLENCTVQFGAVAQSITPHCRTVIRNTAASFIAGSVPTSLIVPSSGGGVFDLLVEGINLSAMVTGKALVNAATNNVNGRVTFKDCRLGSGATIVSGTFLQPGAFDLALIRCDSGDTNYRTERHNYFGSQTTETTIVRTGGASDGTTPIAWTIVTGANTRWECPFDCLPISVWNETTGSAVTVTIEGIWGGGAVPLDDEIWIECEYLGTSGFPLASKATSCTRADGLAAGANIPAGSGTWGGSTTQFAMSATFTPQEKGPITIYVRAAKVSSTFYIDPKPVIT